MLKRSGVLFALIAAAMMFSGCAAGFGLDSPVTGLLFADVTAPVAVTGTAEASKVGTAKATSFLGLFAKGDASIETACKSAGITEIHHVDKKVKHVLGIFATYEVIVYGN